MFALRSNKRIPASFTGAVASRVALLGIPPAVTRRLLPIMRTVSKIHEDRRHYSLFLGVRGILNRKGGRRFYAALPPHNVIKMPALSPTMTTGNVGRWQKKVGDQISPGDVLLDIETDKAQMDFECQEDGYLAKILIESGAKDVPVGQPIGVLVEDQGDISKFADFSIDSLDSKATAGTVEEPKPATEPQKETKGTTSESSTSSQESSPKLFSERIFASPLARKIANERGIPLDQITGTGPNDRIIKADIDNYVPPSILAKPHAVTPTPPAVPPPGLEYTDIPLSNIRRVIAARLTESKQTVPHYYLTVEVEMDKVLKLREVLNQDSNGKYKLSVNDFIIKSSALALKDVPEVNSAWHGEFIRQYLNSDISIATATPTGLITPIVTKAETKGLASISNQVKELAGRAREGKLAPYEYQGGSFSISNLGMFGIKSFTAIINPPQSCILAVGGTNKKLIPDESQTTGYRIANTMHVTLSCDHRVVDGAVGAQWLKAWRSYIENPLRLLL
ncbi:hypothetical protein G9A89_000851 [Geosiphon pyriformis]|nr:hypothetical protein G9A89_000851 [Geosiphon pyriformis]